MELESKNSIPIPVGLLFQPVAETFIVNLAKFNISPIIKQQFLIYFSQLVFISGHLLDTESKFSFVSFSVVKCLVSLRVSDCCLPSVRQVATVIVASSKLVISFTVESKCQRALFVINAIFLDQIKTKFFYSKCNLHRNLLIHFNFLIWYYYLPIREELNLSSNLGRRQEKNWRQHQPCDSCEL